MGITQVRWKTLLYADSQLTFKSLCQKLEHLVAV